ncbi:4Fe-4S dicluster domain-containing protein [Cellulosilyticum sp. I15G10I2]|uniref:4Fe-4S dicluster domain-containing protein n=1 Tax=Cellulosilyticum sp. I15G10I2 TaxID=1892843 RepID=UPI00085C2BC7|nr:4Fe-4S dicluster domain-containing protein [Cellulosilyticum sp. I15G10I2]
MQFTEIIKASGIVGSGGAGFPTHVKLSVKAEYFIVNAAECEPLLEVDKYLIRERAKELIRGIDWIARNIRAAKKYIAIKKKYETEIRCLKQAIEEAKSTVKIFEMESFYPAGDEQVIVYEITGRVVPERNIPLQVGAVVNNVGTVLAVYDAKRQGVSVTHKYLSVVGAVKNRVILRVPIGTSVSACIEEAAPLEKDYGIIMGGPMMGKIYSSKEEASEAVVTKTDGNILIVPKDHHLITKGIQSIRRIKNISKSACIQCRMCTDLCPREVLGHSVKPHLIMRNIYREEQMANDDEYIKTFGSAVNCTECGLCELYSCPMMLSPRRANSYIKSRLTQMKLTIPQNPLKPVDSERAYKKVPTSKLMLRLGLQTYYSHESLEHVVTFTPQRVKIPMKQHIGVSSQPIVQVGDRVEEGQLIAQIPEAALGANSHASINGCIAEVGDYIVIEAQE